MIDYSVPAFLRFSIASTASSRLAAANSMSLVVRLTASGSCLWALSSLCSASGVDAVLNLSRVATRVRYRWSCASASSRALSAASSAT